MDWVGLVSWVGYRSLRDMSEVFSTSLNMYLHVLRYKRLPASTSKQPRKNREEEKTEKIKSTASNSWYHNDPRGARKK